MLTATYFESHPEGRYELVLGNRVDVRVAEQELVNAGIPTDKETVLGHFAIQLDRPEDMATAQSVILGEIIEARVPVGQL